MNGALTRSYAWCERLAQREAGNFYHAFRLLPDPQRRSMSALYAFLRIADDLSDGPQGVAIKRRLLADWRGSWRDALTGRYAHPLHAALHHTVDKHHIPLEYFDAALDGVEMDLTTTRYETFADLRLYCYRVASVVGLSCIHIWGFASEQAKIHAEQAGLAFQLTNILRDLGEDAARGRVYLPQEDLDRFGYDPRRLAAGERDEHFRALMRFEVGRARGFYESANPLLQQLFPAGRAVYLVMARTYRGILELIEQRDYDVFSSRVRLSKWRKLFFALAAFPTRLGWS